MMFPHNYLSFTAFWISLPMAAMMGIALETFEDFDARRWPDKSDILRGLLKWVLIWLPLYGTAILINKVFHWYLLSHTAFYIFYTACFIIYIRTFIKFWKFATPAGRLLNTVSNMFRPDWNKRPFRNNSTGHFLISDENRKQDTIVEELNLKAIEKVSDDRKLLKIAKKAYYNETAYAALGKLQNKDLALQCPDRLRGNNSLVLKLLGAKTVEAAISKTANPGWLFILLESSKDKKQIKAIFDKLAPVADIRKMALNERNKPEVREEAIRRCGTDIKLQDLDLEFARNLNPDILLELAGRCKDQAYLQTLLDSGRLDNYKYLAILPLINDKKFIIRQICHTGRKSESSEIIKLLDDKSIRENTAEFLDSLQVSTLLDIINKLGPCPDCGGKIISKSESHTRTIAGPADSFYRESVSYRDTYTVTDICCGACNKKYATSET